MSAIDDPTLRVEDPALSPMARLRAAYGGLSVDLRRLLAIGFIEIMAVSFYSSLLMPYYRSLGYGSETAGVLNSIIQVVSALVAVGAGVMADSMGRKKMYITGQLMRCAAAGLLIATKSYAGLVLVSITRGLAAVQAPASLAISASHTRKDNRATLLGVTQTAAQFASVIAPLMAGFVADRFGIRASFGIGLALASLSVVVAIPLKDGTAQEVAATRTTPSSDAPIVSPETKESVSGRVKRMFRENRPTALLALLSASLSNGLANGATNILLPFMIMDRFSSAYTTISTVNSFGSLGTMLVLLVGGRIADKRGRRGLVLTSGALLPVLMLSIFAATSLWQLLCVIVLLTMVGNISSPALSAVNMEAVGPTDRATFAGLQMCLQSTGLALGSVAAGIGYRINPTWAWMVVITLFASQFPLFAIALPKESRG